MIYSFSIIWIFFLILLLSWSVYIINRNRQVAEYRHRLLNQISNKINEDRKKIWKAYLKNPKKGLGKYEWKWRYDAYEKVTYDEMYWKFWKPLDSFYKDLSFIK
jgi:hypothetical protein